MIYMNSVHAFILKFTGHLSEQVFLPWCLANIVLFCFHMLLDSYC